MFWRINWPWGWFSLLKNEVYNVNVKATCPSAGETPGVSSSQKFQFHPNFTNDSEHNFYLNDWKRFMKIALDSFLPRIFYSRDSSFFLAFQTLPDSVVPKAGIQSPWRFSDVKSWNWPITMEKYLKIDWSLKMLLHWLIMGVAGSY